MSGLFGQAAAGFGAAVLASMGMGGGSVLILWLTLVSGVGQREAQGLNLLFFLPVGALSLWLHRRAGRVDLPAAKALLPAGICGGLLGAAAAAWLDPGLLRRGFAIFLFFIGLRQLFPGRQKSRLHNRTADGQTNTGGAKNNE